MRMTVGPLPPAVYWRRRAIVLAGGLAVLFLVGQACMSEPASPDRAAGGTRTPTPTASPAATAGSIAPATGLAVPLPSGQPAQSAPATTGPAGGTALDPADPDACTDQEMLITAETEPATFPVGGSVQFTIRIQNVADRSCQRDIGGDHRELYLRTSTGASKVWSSRDCGGPTGSDVQELAPGFETTYFIAWSGRSSTSCAGGEPAGGQVAPGDYQLVARLGTAVSEPVAITVI